MYVCIYIYIYILITIIIIVMCFELVRIDSFFHGRTCVQLEIARLGQRNMDHGVWKYTGVWCFYGRPLFANRPTCMYYNIYIYIHNVYYTCMHICIYVCVYIYIYIYICASDAPGGYASSASTLTGRADTGARQARGDWARSGAELGEIRSGAERGASGWGAWGVERGASGRRLRRRRTLRRPRRFSADIAWFSPYCYYYLF